MTRMTNAGNRPILKIYPETGHFIHTDNPVEFSADVVDFVTKGVARHLVAAWDGSHDQGRRGVGLAGGADAPGAAPTAGLNK